MEVFIYLSSSSPFSKLARLWELGLLSISLAKRAALASSFLNKNNLNIKKKCTDEIKN